MQSPSTESPPKLGSHLVTLSDGTVLYRPPASEGEFRALWGGSLDPEALAAARRSWTDRGCRFIDDGSARCETPGSSLAVAIGSHVETDADGYITMRPPLTIDEARTLSPSASDADLWGIVRLAKETWADIEAKPDVAGRLRCEYPNLGRRAAATECACGGGIACRCSLTDRIEQPNGYGVEPTLERVERDRFIERDKAVTARAMARYAAECPGWNNPKRWTAILSEEQQSADRGP